MAREIPYRVVVLSPKDNKYITIENGLSKEQSEGLVVSLERLVDQGNDISLMGKPIGQRIQ